MIYLFLSILFSSLINVIFRLFNRFKIDNQQAITFNYLVCVVTGLIFDFQQVDVQLIHFSELWVWLSLSLGALFIIVFVGMAITARKDGISVSVVAAKMGVVFPIIFATFYLNEPLSGLLLAGIVMSLMSVYFTSRKSGKKGILVMTIIPLLVFIGSGTIDTFLKIIEQNKPTDVSSVMPVILIFFSAGIFGLIVWFFRLYRKTSTWHPKHLLAGIALGIPNYFSIYFLFMALSSKSLQTAQIFPVNNVSIVLFSTLISVLFFKEKLSKINYIGLIMAILAIIMISQ